MKVTFSGHFLSCPGRIRTHANGTRIRCATVTPQDNSSIAVQIYCFFLNLQAFDGNFLRKKLFLGKKSGVFGQLPEGEKALLAGFYGAVIAVGRDDVDMVVVDPGEEFHLFAVGFHAP